MHMFGHMESIPLRLGDPAICGTEVSLFLGASERQVPWIWRFMQEEVEMRSVASVDSLQSYSTFEFLGCDDCIELHWPMMIAKMTLYWLKSSGASFRDKLEQVLYDMNYRHSIAGPDVWMRPAVKDCGFKYYEYVLCYADNVLCISDVPLKKIDDTKAVFKLKGYKA